MTTTSAILLPSIAHLYKLANYPVVLHVSLAPSQLPDYSAITAIRNSGWTFLQSESLQEAQDMAATAHALAVRSGKGVVHFFDPNSSSLDKPISAEDADLVGQILNLDDVRRYQSSSVATSGIYADDGRVAVASVRPETQITPGANDLTESAILGAVSKVTSAEVSEKSSQQSESVASPSVSEATTIESSAPQVTSEDIYKYVVSIWTQLRDSTGREYHTFEWSGPSTADKAIFVFGSDAGLFAEALDSAKPTDVYAKAGMITARLYRPWLGAKLLDIIPKSVERLAVLEQVSRKTTKWGPLLIDVLTSVKSSPGGGVSTIVGHQLGYIAPETMGQALKGVFQNLSLDKPLQNLEIGKTELGEESRAIALEKPKLETAYTKILDQLFGERVFVANALQSKNAGISSTIAASPEFGFGSLLARKEHRDRFVKEVKLAASTSSFTTEAPVNWLAKWAASAEDAQKAGEIADGVIARLQTDGSPAARDLLTRKSLFRKESLWLVGSDVWSYDLGNSGVHHVLASGENVNMLIIDSTPYSERAAADAERRKKDIGLYAMNFGNAYVASTAVYGSYTQVLQAMLEADQFDGPSIVLAYLPYFGEHDTPLAVLQETKKAVDLGYWPLYRWNPSNETKGEPNFSLDSERIKDELKKFLARDNQLTQLMQREPTFAASLAQDFGTEVRAQQKRKAKDAYNQLLEGLFGAPLTILFASDNGNAQSLAKRLGTRGRARGLKTTVTAMEDYLDCRPG